MDKPCGERLLHLCLRRGRGLPLLEVCLFRCSLLPLLLPGSGPTKRVDDALCRHDFVNGPKKPSLGSHGMGADGLLFDFLFEQLLLF